jgi:hypothetical protein
MNDIWRLAGHDSVTDKRCGSEVLCCPFKDSVCKHVGNDSMGTCWDIFPSGRVRVCSQFSDLNVLDACETLAKELCEVASR